MYALLFADTGLSTAEISSLFAIWSITSFALEIPSGVLADATSRRVLLAGAPLLTAAGYALWTFAPSYASFAVGFALWGASGALQSGAFEALAYEELDRLGAAPHYPAVMGRATACGTVAVAMATALAAPVLAADGFTAVGIASIAAALAAAIAGAALPEHRAGRGRRRRRDRDGEDGLTGYLELLRNGAAAVRRQPRLRAALLFVPAVAATWGSLDEYLPLLAVEAGGSTEIVPLLLLLVCAGMAAGGLAASRVSRMAPPGLATLLLLSAGALAAGALVRVPAGFALIALAFGAFQALTVTADARLQAAIDNHGRATITSFAGFATEILVVLVFAVYALGSQWADHATLFACFAALHVAIAAWVWRLPDRVTAVAKPMSPRRSPGPRGHVDPGIS